MSKQILLVEDEAILAMTQKRQLEKYGYEVRTVTSGEKAVEALELFSDIDLILMDINLGKGIDGTQAAEIILQEKEKDIPIVFLSSHTEPEIVEKTEKITSYGYVVKGSNITVLDASIKMALKLFDAKRAHDQKEAALLESESRFYELFQRAPLGYQSLDANGTFLEVNQAWLETLGYHQEEVIGKWFGDFLAPEYVQPFRERFPIFLAQGRIHSEFYMLHKDGQRKYIAFDGRVGHHEDGSFKQTHCILKDETERKKAEDALEKRLIALTQPIDSPELTFDDLFNIADLQRLQDEFSLATNVASIITRPDGTPITTGSNFSRLCNDIIRQTKTGCANCLASDALLGQPSLDGPRVQLCMSGGLWDAGAAISVGGHHIANWLIGQVRNEAQTEEKIRAYAQRIGADEEAVVEAFYQVPAMSRSQFEKIASALFTLASQLSNFAYQNVQQARFITERKEMESNLKESMSRLDELVTNIPVGVYILWTRANGNKEFEYVSNQFCKIHGVNKDQLLADSAVVDDLVHPDDRESFLDCNRKAALEGKPFFWEGRFFYGKGEVRWFRIESTPNKRTTGDTCWFGVSQDITEWKQAESELQRFKTVSDNAVYGNAIADLEGNLLYINNFFAQIHGYEPQELIGRPFTLFHNEQQLFAAKKLVDTMIKEGSFKPATTWHCHRDGRVFPMLMSGILLKDENGEPQYIAASAVDLTSQIQTEEKYQRLFQNSNDAIFVHSFGDDNLPSNNIDVNEQAVRLLGYTREELLQISAKDVVPEKHGPAMVLHAQELIENKHLTFETENIRSDGVIIPVEVSAYLYTENNTNFVVSSVRDITRRKRAENEIQKQLSEKEVLLKEVYHRIKNNMAQVESLLSLQAESSDQAEVKTALNESITRIQSIRVLYDKLLISNKNEVISVKNYIESLVESITGVLSKNQQISNQQISIEKWVADFPLGSSKAIPIGIIINELLTNIYKYAFQNREKGCVTIDLKKVGTQVILSITDDGVGLHSIDGTNSSPGFGLTIVQMLAEQLDGHFSMVNENGTRSVLEFEL